MPIALENVGIAVRALEGAIAFFTDLGLTVRRRGAVSGEWADTAVGLDGRHVKIVEAQTLDARECLELVSCLHPDPINADQQPRQVGMHRVAFAANDFDAITDPIRRSVPGEPGRG